ncbi:MAG TPA: SMI1/KNR4 family protein [Solirubrobacteraceae bacterium]|nr:SMI1/KNR4 family protein [Solirubrobacteraceae bacterium]
MPIDELVARLRQDGDHETYPAATGHDIAATEQALSRPLPVSFRYFATEFSNGGYLFMLQEVSATGAGNRQIGAIQDVIAYAISASPTEDIALENGGAVEAGALVPFSLDSNGNCWCFLTGESVPDGEYPVAYFVADQKRLVGCLPGFEHWLRKLVDERDEVIRTMYNPEELDLG